MICATLNGVKLIVSFAEIHIDQRFHGVSGIHQVVTFVAVDDLLHFYVVASVDFVVARAAPDVLVIVFVSRASALAPDGVVAFVSIKVNTGTFSCSIEGSGVASVNKVVACASFDNVLSALINCATSNDIVAFTTKDVIAALLSVHVVVSCASVDVVVSGRGSDVVVAIAAEHVVVTTWIGS